MKFLILICFFLVMKNSIACSFYVNDNYQKNLLIAHGASHLDIDLSKVTESDVSVYKKIFTGNATRSSCPNFLETEAAIRFEYSPEKGENCEAELTVHRKEFVGEVLTGPIEIVSYAGVSASCSAVSEVTPVIKPIRYYRIPKRPFSL